MLAFARYTVLTIVLFALGLPVWAQPVNETDAEGFGLGYRPAPMDWSATREQAQQLPRRTLRGPAAQESYDLRQVNGGAYLPPMRNQGACGSCWAFTAYGALETWHRVELGQTWDFSENHLNNNHGFLPAPCEGGNETMAIAYLTRGDGPALEQDDPYGTNGTIPGNPDAPPRKLLTQARALYTMADIKQAVVDYGAVYSSLEWSSAAYDRDTFTYYYTGPRTGNGHGGAIVGWDDNKVTQAPEPGAWIIRNSWGKSWGEDGYYYIAYDCELAVINVEPELIPATAFCGTVAPDAYAGNYSHTPYGAVDIIGYDGPEAWFASVYTAQGDELVTGVGFATPGYGASYEITLYDDVDTNTGTFSNPLAPPTTGTLYLPGYYTVDLAQAVPVTAGDDFSVVVYINSPGMTEVVVIERDYLVSLGDEEDLCDADSAPGRSFISADGALFTDTTTLGSDTEVFLRALTVAPEDYAVGAIQAIPTGDWVVEGEVVTLQAPGVGGWTWLRYDESGGVWQPIVDAPARLVGQGTALLAFNPVMPADAGLYKCRYDAGMTRDLRETEEFLLTVRDAEAFPAAGAWGLGLLLGGCAVVGILVVMRRR